ARQSSGSTPVSSLPLFSSLLYYLFHHTATRAIYTLSLHDALPISSPEGKPIRSTTSSICTSAETGCPPGSGRPSSFSCTATSARSEEHTSELQSRENLVCRLLLEKKK